MTDWPTLIRRYSPAVWETVYRVLGNEADASDALQETFIAALALERTAPVAHWEAVLRHLATARAIDLLRRRLRDQRRTADGAECDSFAGALPAPDNRPELREMLDQLRRQVAELPPDQAEMYCLRYVQEWSYRRIAEATGLTENAVGVSLNRIRERLAKRLAKTAVQSEVKHDPQ